MLKLFRNVFFVLCLAAISGCGLIDHFFLPAPEDTAQELYESANDALLAKNYSKAAKNFAKLKDSFPFSPYTVNAELSLGDAYYLNGEYTLAAEAYKEFESMHPRHEAIPYVLYQTGMSLIKSFISIDRPTTMVGEALQYLTRLRDTYPGSDHAAKAPAAIAEGRKLMAEHELYLANVFYNMDLYGPAWRRYSYIAENFADVPEAHKLAQEKALSAYSKYRKSNSEKTRESIEGTWKDWFRWL
jgi:outer membrane protein assembly factor BamD